MKKETIITILATVVAIFIILIIVGATENKKEDKMISVPIDNKTSEFKDGFIEGCMGEDTSYEVCSCGYDRLVYTYGTDGLLELSANYIETEKIPTEVVNIMVSCME